MMNNIVSKIQKNPFLTVLTVIVIGVAIFALVSLSSAIKESADSAITTTTAAVNTTTASVGESEVVNDNKIQIEGLKFYSESIKKVEAFSEPNQIVFNVEFKDKESLLENHFVTTYSFNVVPMLCFYIDSGVQVKIPGEFRILSDDVTAVYSFSNIKDYVNAYFLTDGVVTDLSTLLQNKFNLYIEHFTNDGVGKTLAGNYAQTVEQFNLAHAATPLDIEILSSGIKRVETTVSDKFIWIDIYYVDEAAYLKDNADLNQNFVEFGFEKGGNLYDRQFIINEYDNIYMNRCIFDKTAMDELAADMYVDDITVKQFFNEYEISVWSIVPTEESPMFNINGGSYAFADIGEDTDDTEVIE